MILIDTLNHQQKHESFVDAARGFRGHFCVSDLNFRHIDSEVDSNTVLIFNVEVLNIILSTQLMDTAVASMVAVLINQAVEFDIFTMKENIDLFN